MLPLALFLLVPPVGPPRPPGLAADLAPPVHVLAGGKPLDVERSGHAAPFVGDFDGDGRPDLLVGQFVGGKLRVYRNTGTAAAPKLDAFTYFFAEGSGAPEFTVWLNHFWKLGAVAGAWTALGLGAVSMLRSVGPAIGAVLGFYFFESLISLWDPYETVSATAASLAIFGLEIPPGFEDFVPGGSMTTLHAALVLVGWTAVGFLLTWWGLRRKDA